MGPKPVWAGLYYCWSRPPAAAASMCDQSRGEELVDVAIIGAGLSGLVCADALQKRLGWHTNIAILEARDRVGGRLATTPGGVDLGGSWLWPGYRHVAALAQRLGVSMVRQHLDGQVLFKPAPQARVEHIGAIGGRVSLCGPDARRLLGGYTALTKDLARGLSPNALRLGVQAVGIRAWTTEDGSSRVRVSYRVLDGGGISDDAAHAEAELDARRVVLAAPPRVLLETMRFDPPLPETQVRAMRATPTWAAGWGKVVATFRSNFWRENGESGVALTDGGPIGCWWEGAAKEAGDEVDALVGVSFGTQTANQTANRIESNRIESYKHAPRT